MTPGEIASVLIIFLLLIAVLFYLLYKKKKGTKCIGCPYCDSCPSRAKQKCNFDEKQSKTNKSLQNKDVLKEKE